uniref:Uncharacterized protein n=1 Tax=Globisporangium ultimum (strain ATCC 200006 / CBS 805.95 / DAOM BR144) TaxID=431595 RepID=K3WMX6_GLOUD
MTRDAGASRTFRSIFHQELQEDELRIHVNRDESGMDDDDALWSDDAAPKARGGSCSDGFEDAGEDGDGEQQHGEEDNNLNDTMLIMDDDDDAADDEGADAPRSDELRIPHRRSMEEWADDDDEEDTWKDMLQAKVNQLELVIQQNSNNHMDTATATNTNSTINGETAANADAESACIAGRPANRHKIQRTSTLHSHAAMMAGSQLHPHKHALSGVTMSPTTWLNVLVLVNICVAVGKTAGCKEDGSNHRRIHYTRPWRQGATIFDVVDCWAHAVVVLDKSNASEKLPRCIHRQQHPQ